VIPYGRQSVDDDDIDAVVRVLKGDWLTRGPAVEAFEKALAERVEARHANPVRRSLHLLHRHRIAPVEPQRRVVDHRPRPQRAGRRPACGI